MPQPLTATAARRLTSRIRSNINELAELMHEAWVGRAWEPLGYDSFAAWLDGEFQWSHARGYQLISMHLMEQKLQAAAALPDGFRITDRQCRLIIHTGADDFLAELSNAATSDEDENNRLLLTMLRTAARKDGNGTVSPPPAPPLVTALPVAVSNAVRDSRTSLSMLTSLHTQARNLPKPESISSTARSTLTKELLTVERLLTTALAAFDAAVERQERASDVA